MAEPSAIGATLAGLKASSGMTWAQLADAIGASGPDYVRKVASGVKPGHNLAGAVRQLAERGRVTEPPPRRRTASGGIARVRGAGGVSRVPVEPDRRRYAGRFSTATTFTHGGRGRIVSVDAPRSEGIGRERARAAILDALRSAASDRRRVSFVLEFDNGARATIGGKGGYDPALIVRRVRVGEDVLEWLAGQAAASKYRPGGPVVSVDTVVAP